MTEMRFSLRSFVIAIALIASFLAWYGPRIRRYLVERTSLTGTWQLIDEAAAPVIIAGKPVTINFGEPGTTLKMAQDRIGQIDFRSAQLGAGVSRAIYCWEGKRLRFAQADNDYKRPTDFKAMPGHSVWLVERISE